MKCKGCQIDQDKNPYKERLFLTDDGYCTVCNAKYKDRPRTKSIFAFKTIKEGKNLHLTYNGSRNTEYMNLRKKAEKEYNVNAAPSIAKQILESRKRRITEFL